MGTRADRSTVHRDQYRQLISTAPSTTTLRNSCSFAWSFYLATLDSDIVMRPLVGTQPGTEVQGTMGILLSSCTTLFLFRHDRLLLNGASVSNVEPQAD